MVKTISLKATPSHYLLELDRSSVMDGPTLLQAGGETVAVLISEAEYDAFQTWQVAQRQALISRIPQEFTRAVNAFQELLPALQADYAGRAVAVYQDQVIAAGDDKMAVLAYVLKQYGPIPCYIEWVESEAPRRARIPSTWVAR